jgi:hypothetical protein
LLASGSVFGIAATVWRGASAPLASSHKDQFVTERADDEMPSGFRCGKRFCLY